MNDKTIILISLIALCICIAIIYMKMVNIYFELQKRKAMRIANDSERLFEIYKSNHPEANRDITINKMIKGLKEGKTKGNIKKVNIGRQAQAPHPVRTIDIRVPCKCGRMNKCGHRF